MKFLGELRLDYSLTHSDRTYKRAFLRRCRGGGETPPRQIERFSPSQPRSHRHIVSKKLPVLITKRVDFSTPGGLGRLNTTDDAADLTERSARSCNGADRRSEKQSIATSTTLPDAQWRYYLEDIKP